MVALGQTVVLTTMRPQWGTMSAPIAVMRGTRNLATASAGPRSLAAELAAAQCTVSKHVILSFVSLEPCAGRVPLHEPDGVCAWRFF